ANEEKVFAMSPLVGCGESRVVGVDAGKEIRFDRDAFRFDVEEAVDEHLPGGAGETDQPVDPLPGAEEIVQPGAGEEPAGVEGRVPVDAAADGLEREDAGHAVEKNFILNKEETRRTEDAEVMNCMHHGNAAPTCRDENGWGSGEEPVVHMDDIGFEQADGPAGLPEGYGVEKED